MTNCVTQQHSLKFEPKMKHIQWHQHKQRLGEQGNKLHPKTSRDLSKFDRLMAQSLCSRNAAEVMEGLNGTHTAAIPANVQSLMQALRQLASSRSVGCSAALTADQDPPPPATPAPQVQAVGGSSQGAQGAASQGAQGAAKAKKASTARQDKCNNMGEGLKSCKPCGWRQGGPDGKLIYEHRGVCRAYCTEARARAHAKGEKWRFKKDWQPPEGWGWGPGVDGMW